MIAIPLHKAPEELRISADRLSGQDFGAPEWEILANDRRALASLLDGDGDGGLLARRDGLSEALVMHARNGSPAADHEALLAVVDEYDTTVLAFIAVYVSAVLGTEVHA